LQIQEVVGRKGMTAEERLQIAIDFIRDLHAVAGHDIECFGPCKCLRQRKFKDVLGKLIVPPVPVNKGGET